MANFVISYCFIGFLYFLVIFLSNKLEKVSQSKLKKNDMLCQSIDESLNNIDLIKTYNLNEFWCNKNLNIFKKIYKNNIKINKFKNLFEKLSNVTIALCLTIIYGIGSVLVFKEYMTIGTIFALSPLLPNFNYSYLRDNKQYNTI